MLRTFAIAILFSLLTSAACAEAWGPWEAPAQTQPSRPQLNPLETVIRQFQKHISSVDGPRCPMFPTCSDYGLQAMKKHGPVLGTFVLVDRIYREQDSEQASQTKISKYGYIRYYDPLQSNDFWLPRK